MNEENIVFHAGKLCIEGRYAESGTLKGAVVAHPHPMLGGDMYNHVVETIITSLFNKGYSTLRFNFRGVGKSEGAYDDGFGEQADIEGAADYLAKKGKTNVILAGYSFGAWIISKVAARNDHFEHLVFVSPPVKVLTFDFSNINGGQCLIISGGNDQFSEICQLTELSDLIGCRLEIVKGADHFYSGYTEALAKIMDQYVD